MKKAITSFMIIFTLLIGSTISVKAAVQVGDLLPPSSIFEGTGYWIIYEGGVVSYIEASAYAVTDANSNVILDITVDGTTTQYVLYPKGIYNHYYNNAGDDMGVFNIEEDGSYCTNACGYYGALTMISTADFTGTKIISNTTMSSTGEYMVVIGGSISGTFEAGRHQVTNATSQPLSIFIVNQTNGATRLMTATTINSMYVTVSGGQITKIEINGRAQTTPGNFDTYSIVI